MTNIEYKVLALDKQKQNWKCIKSKQKILNKLNDKTKLLIIIQGYKKIKKNFILNINLRINPIYI